MKYRKGAVWLIAAAVTVMSTSCGSDDGSTSVVTNAPSRNAVPPSGTVSPTATVSGNPSAQDTRWLTSAHQAGLAEIQVGQLAVRNGQTEEIRSLGTLLIEDHHRLDGRIQALAARLGVDLPTSPTTEQASIATRLTGQPASRFDLEFVTAMRSAHRTAVADAENEVSTGTDQSVKALAQEALTALKKHLDKFEKAT
jgi:putative membrane protein